MFMNLKQKKSLNKVMAKIKDVRPVMLRDICSSLEKTYNRLGLGNAAELDSQFATRDVRFGFGFITDSRYERYINNSLETHRVCKGIRQNLMKLNSILKDILVIERFRDAYADACTRCETVDELIKLENLLLTGSGYSPCFADIDSDLCSLLGMLVRSFIAKNFKTETKILQHINKLANCRIGVSDYYEKHGLQWLPKF